jgi:serine/threonine protein kinase
VLRVAIEVSAALAYAHGRGVIHRDVKPGNIMLTAFGAKLLDFGLARFGQEAEALGALPPSADASLSITGLMLGTPQYMAPEQIERREVDARTDIFALGAVVFEMATGRKAFEAATPGEPVSPATPNAGIPFALGGLVSRCLKKSPDERWQSAGVVVAELQRIERETTPRTESGARSKFRAGVAAAVITVVAAGAWALRRSNRSAPGATEHVLYRQY